MPGISENKGDQVFELHEPHEVLVRRQCLRVFDDVLERMDKEGKIGTSRSLLHKTIWDRLGATTMFRVVFVAVVVQSVWTVVYAIHLTQESHSCLADACREPNSTSFRGGGGSAGASSWGAGGAEQGAGEQGGCLVIAPLNGHLGSCSGAVAVTPFQSFEGRSLHGGMAPAVEIRRGTSCSLGCTDGPPNWYRVSGRTEVHCSASGVLEPAHCTLDTLRLLDPEDNSYLSCVSWTCPTAKEQQFYAWCMIFAGIFLQVLGIDWLVHENVYACRVFLLIASFLTMRALYVPLRGLEESDSDYMPVANAVICSGFMLFYSSAAYRVRKDFGAYIYRITKTHTELRAVFWIYTIFLTLAKVDLLCVTLNVVTGFIFFYDDADEQWFAFLAAPLQLALMMAGFYGARQESKPVMMLFFATTLGEPAYHLYKIWAVYSPNGTKYHDESIWKPAVTASTVSIGHARNNM